jgi:hypothetical protein
MRFIIYISLIIILGSCSVIRNTPKFGLQDGVYQTNQENVFIETQNDTLFVFSENGGKQLNCLPFSASTQHSNFAFNKSTFDLDVLAIPVKFRVSQSGIPSQLSNEINAALYLGKRKDYFRINFEKSPTNRFKRKIDHYGFSMGGFVGLGNSVINSDVSQGAIPYEYQGITFSKGIAGIIAINNFTLGVAYGFDNLLDKNSSQWIYNQKPWVGLALGLNLN